MIRQQVFAFVAILMVAVSLTGYANAQPTGSGFIAENDDALVGAAPVVIPDFDPNLTTPTVNLANTVFSTVTITSAEVAAIDNGGTISDVFFTIEGLTHSHLSDLVVSVTHLESNRTATLFSRVGIEDDGTDLGSNGIVDNQNIDGIGDSSNLGGSYRFQDGGDSLFVVAGATADDAIIPTLNSDGPGAPVYAASGVNNGPVGLLAAFGFDDDGNALTLPDIVGNYEFAISDRSNLTPVSDVIGNPSGVTFQSFTQTNVAFLATVDGAAIPEPGSATAMLLAMVGFAARRRKA